MGAGVAFNSHVKLLFVSPLFYSIGNAAEEILWAYARAVLLNKKLVVIAPYKWTQILSYRICNEALFSINFGDDNRLTQFETAIARMMRCYVNLSFFLKRAFNLSVKKITNKSLGDHWNFPMMGRSTYWPYKNGAHQLGNVERDPILKTINALNPPSLNKIIESECDIRLKEFGVDAKQKFICLHVRGSGFHGDANRRPYRNADIKNYTSAIKYLLSLGYRVFRMGDSSMEAADIKDPLFIDYPFTSIKSPEMDLFLIKHCNFYIGMQSGILDVAHLFMKPVLILNMYEWFVHYPLKEIDRGMLKKVTIKGKSTPLELHARLELPFFYTDNRNQYTDELSFIENSPDDILNAIRAYEQYISCGQEPVNFEKMHEIDNFVKKRGLDFMAGTDDLDKTFVQSPPVLYSRYCYRSLASKGALYTEGLFNN